MRPLTQWTFRPDAASFPYEHVVAEFQRAGKHFVADEMLDALDRARDLLPEARGTTDSLAKYLSVLLDKRDGTYDYASYLALDVFPELDKTSPWTSRDRLVAHLVADVLLFELAAADGETDLLPRERPTAFLLEKRLRLGLRAIAPPLARLGLGAVDRAAPVAAQTRRVVDLVLADQSPAERHTMRVTMLPVDTIHDEYMFIRVLQAFETTFSALAIGLGAAVGSLTAGDARDAARWIEAAAATLREAAPLFSLVATMQVQSFQTFRKFTDGASAIQSSNYKLMEALCRPPDPARIDSAAFTSVPDVRDLVLAGLPTISDAAALAEHRDDKDLTQALDTFARAVEAWRLTHTRIATRMLGTATGTGNTPGVPYLNEVLSVPVFSNPAEGSRP